MDSNQSNEKTLDHFGHWIMTGWHGVGLKYSDHSEYSGHIFDRRFPPNLYRAHDVMG
jgi:hypothetical protein